MQDPLEEQGEREEDPSNIGGGPYDPLLLRRCVAGQMVRVEEDQHTTAIRLAPV